MFEDVWFNKQNIPHHNNKKTAAQLPDQILEQSQGTGDFSFAVLLKADPQGDGERRADQGYDDDAVIVLNIGFHPAVPLVLNLPLPTGIATASQRTAHFTSH